MSDPSDHPMDRRLQECARQRRETPGAPTELHPANRKILLQQVRDSYPAPSAPSKPTHVRAVWWAWPRLATVGMGTLAVIVMAFFAWREFQVGPSQMARLEPANPEATIPGADKVSSLSKAASSEVRVDAFNSESVSEPQALPATSPLAYREGDRLKRTGGVKQPARVVTTDGLAVASADRTQGGIAATTRSAGSAPAAAVLASVAPAAPATPAPSPQSTGFVSSPVAGLTLDFVQTAVGEGASAVTGLTRSRRLELSPRSKAVDPNLAVLRRFQINAVDGQFDVRDGDGSVYRGFILPVTLEAQSAVSPASSSVGGSPIEGVQGNSLNSQAMIAGLYRFQAQGSNRSLRQWVVMNGYLSNAAGSMKDAHALSGSQQSTAAPTSGRSQSWEIQSRIQLGTQTPTTLRARQAPTVQTPP